MLYKSHAVATSQLKQQVAKGLSLWGGGDKAKEWVG